MKRAHRITVLAWLLVAAMTGPAAAQTVFTNGLPSGADGHSMADDFRSADDFSFLISTSFNHVRFWGLLPTGPAYSPNVLWEILSDAGGTPGGSLASGSAGATSTYRAAAVSGYDSWQFDMSIGSQTLGPGVFWLALHDGALEEATFSGMLWETSNGGSGANYVEGFGNDWAPFEGNLAFELSNVDDGNTTPEPTTWILVGTGLVAIAVVRRHIRPTAC